MHLALYLVGGVEKSAHKVSVFGYNLRFSLWYSNGQMGDLMASNFRFPWSAAAMDFCDSRITSPMPPLVSLRHSGRAGPHLHNHCSLKSAEPLQEESEENSEDAENDYKY
ncbi:unnamed protein product [Arctia plantaginis]|uniref:Uncharacterized protein n=1 Tax=Arctia plantaginis TaxID=874455 RepID=A0A8S0Z2D6_ARCPL|nr:unnamed protein product [Arctia plantaginis]